MKSAGQKILTLAILLIPGLTYSASDLRDPMQPPAFALTKFRQAKLPRRPQVTKPLVKKAPEKSLVLTSIIYSRDRKIVIIDDQMLAVGDRVRGARVVSISRDEARLVRKGKVIKLSLNKDFPGIRKKPLESDL
jgi:hypothetical protein